jgi:hypothetical protein
MAVAMPAKGCWGERKTSVSEPAIWPATTIFVVVSYLKGHTNCKGKHEPSKLPHVGLVTLLFNKGGEELLRGRGFLDRCDMVGRLMLESC